MGSTSSYGAGGYDVYLLRTDSNGDTLWAKTYGGAGNDEGNSISITSDGGYAIAGYTSSFGAGGKDVYVIKTDSTGNLLWEQTYGGIDDDCGATIQQIADGGYIVAANTMSFGAGGWDYYLIKLTPDVGAEESEEILEFGIRNLELRITQNPFANSTTVSFSNMGHGEKGMGISIYDSSGRLVKSVKLITSTYELGTDLPPGVYFLKVKVGDYTATKKLIKIR